MLKKLKSLIVNSYNKIEEINGNQIEFKKSLEKFDNDLSGIKITLGKFLTNYNNQLKDIQNIQDVEFQIFSQWGDDGIIQFLINKVKPKNKIFIEFGVQDYTESNTRFLLMSNNWSGLIMDGDEKNISKIKARDYYWQYNLKAKAVFVTSENINQLISEENFPEEIGIYHIDIDGNDYWIWKATSNISPEIVIVEYQSLFGFERAITTPYDSEFVRSKGHYSHLYYGTSLLSLCDLAEEKGYYFVGCNSNGNNSYFVRKDKIGNLKPLTAKEGYVYSQFKESRDKNGNLSLLTGEDRLKLLQGMPVFNTRTNSIESL